MSFKKSLQIVFNFKSILLTILSLILTFVCLHFQLYADLPLTLLGIAVVFPIVFSISEAYKRRETALGLYGNLKAHSRALFFATRDWIETSIPEDREQMRVHILEVLTSCRDLLHAPLTQLEDNERAVYLRFSHISLFIKELRTHGLASGEASRANQYLSKMMEAFENMKHIYQYRTPRTLRTYSKIFIYSTPMVYAPYFAMVGKDLHWSLVLITPILLTIMLVGLDNIQDQLENPFDAFGEDDVKINPDKFVALLAENNN